MTKMYRTRNMWELFKEDCPVFARIPVINMWAFGHFVRGYFNYKLPE